MSNRGRILIVDDDAAIRSMVVDWLSEEYEVKSAENGLKALEVLENETFDLVISDINMPGINGFETLRRIRERWPKIKTALITDYDVDTYIKLALEDDITNIIVKTSPFNIDELFRTIDNLICGDKIFGLHNYMSDNTSFVELSLRGSADLDIVREKMLDSIKDTNIYEDRGNNIRMIFEEIASNAIYHAHGYDKMEEVTLKESESVFVSFGTDEERFGFSVIDHSGQLTKEIVLKKILRAMSKEGVFDLSGRGLFLTRNFSDRFIVNIKPGVMTEIVVINYFHDNFKVNKPLYINEV